MKLLLLAMLLTQVVPLSQLEEETVCWCREMMRNSPTALRVLKSAMNAAEDGQAGIQVSVFCALYRAQPLPSFCFAVH